MERSNDEEREGKVKCRKLRCALDSNISATGCRIVTRNKEHFEGDSFPLRVTVFAAICRHSLLFSLNERGWFFDCFTRIIVYLNPWCVNGPSFRKLKNLNLEIRSWFFNYTVFVKILSQVFFDLSMINLKIRFFEKLTNFRFEVLLIIRFNHWCSLFTQDA